MIIRISSLLLFLICFQLAMGKGNGTDKPDNTAKGKILQDIRILCADSLQGRLTGTAGEKLAASYIESRFQQLGLEPFKGRYQWDFTLQGGTVLGNNAFVKVCDKKIKIGTDITFMPYSYGNEFMGSCMPLVDEEDNIWMIPLSKLQLEKTNTPHKILYEHAKSVAAQGPKAIIYYNDIGSNSDLTPNKIMKYDMLNIPVAVMSYNAFMQYIKPNLKKDWIHIEAKLHYEESNSTGKNVMGYIDNKAPLTIIVSANYDHIGFTNGRCTGADNNASGVAGLFYLAEMVKTNHLAGYNYLFIAFSGKEQNLQGSSAFLKQYDNGLSTFAGMINLDMIGRYQSALKSIYISGVATSPYWNELLPKINLGYQFHVDSSGYGFSDMTSFYLTQIPVLRFSTGYHNDYQTENDSPEKINAAGEVEVLNLVYKALSEISISPRPTFSHTRDELPKLKNLKTDLGILPDFSFPDDGIQIGVCLKGRPADKAGFQSGDVIKKIGEYEIVDTDDYIKAIKKCPEDRETAIVILRGGQEFKFFVLMN